MSFPKIVAYVFSLAILLPSLTYGHGGGLDSSGCHRETATGGYHCHRDKDENKYLYIAGGLLAGVVVLFWLWPDDEENTYLPSSDEGLHLVPTQRDKSGLFLEWRF